MRAEFSWATVRIGSAVAGAALVAATAACGATDATAAGDGKTQVIAAFYPLEWLAKKVAGTDATVTSLTSPGVEPHDLELTPRQAISLEGADLVVYIKGVQPAVDEAVEQYAPEAGLDAATDVRTLPATGTGEETADGHAHEEDGHAHEEDGHAHEEDGHADEPTRESGDGHDHDVAYDPHLWLDPDRLAAVATELGTRLAAADPAHAQAYTDRAAATAKELAALDGEMRKGLSECARRTIVTSHAAFGYLTDRYDLKQVGVSGIDPESDPSPARLAEVARIARDEKVTTIFTEALVSPKVAEVLAEEIGATTAVLDPIESAPASGDYMSAMRHNLTQLREALDCR